MIGISQIGVLLPVFFLIFHDFAPTSSMNALRFSNTIIISFLVGYLFFNPSILYGINFTNIGTDKIIKSLKENLKLNEAKLRAYLVSETEMLVYVDKDFKIIQFNQLAEKLVLKKFMRQIKVGEDYRTYLHNSRESMFFVEFEKAISGQRCGYEIELSMNGYDIAKWVQIEFIPIANELNEIIGVNICSINIQGRKALEQQNKNYLKQLQDITWRESHLLRAPISNLLGITKLLNKPDSSISEAEKKALLQMIEREATKLDLEIKNIVSSATSNRT
jgi:PAS domain-containing protein